MKRARKNQRKPEQGTTDWFEEIAQVVFIFTLWAIPTLGAWLTL